MFVTVLFMFPLLGASLIRDTDKTIKKYFPNVTLEKRHPQSFRGIIASNEVVFLSQKRLIQQKFFSRFSNTD